MSKLAHSNQDTMDWLEFKDQIARGNEDLIFNEIKRLDSLNAELLEASVALLDDMAVETLEEAAREDPNDTDSAKSTTAKFRALRAAIAKAEGDQP